MELTKEILKQLIFVDACKFEESSKKLNAKNRGGSLSGTGIKGVTLPKGRNKFIARMKEDGKTIYIGSYDTAEEAQAAYQERARLSSFSERHIKGVT